MNEERTGSVHKYQQNKQSSLTSIIERKKNDMVVEIQAQTGKAPTCGMVKPVNGIPDNICTFSLNQELK
ncbi:MAG: hypothetical protein H0A75_06850 [Candidatus Methanofishera endochildressiae]|uniref:Uncharacterized protein n=1 Tax=Candidatus Methanofishera endochildressiae TaxID=2738884 RepID=A0A7Z0MQ58_9GAMM|nr:hypothetical protein [Candidatus Methanofishera endochildressiae]